MIHRYHAPKRGKASSERTDAAFAGGWCEEDYYRHISAHMAAQDIVKLMEEAEDLATGTFTLGGEPIEVTPINPDDWITGQCEFVLSHVGTCGAFDFLVDGMCDKHRWKSCLVCHEPARHDCPDTFGPMVCGAPLCRNHQHCGQTKAHDPSPNGSREFERKSK